MFFAVCRRQWFNLPIRPNGQSTHQPKHVRILIHFSVDPDKTFCRWRHTMHIVGHFHNKWSTLRILWHIHSNWNPLSALIHSRHTQHKNEILICENECEKNNNNNNNERERHIQSALLRWIINLATDHRSSFWFRLRMRVKSENSEIQMHSKQNTLNHSRMSPGKMAKNEEHLKLPSSRFPTEISFCDIFDCK